jgi:hypothetical protein
LPEPSSAGVALELAERQLARLRTRELEAFLEGEAPYHAACSAAMSKAFSDADRHALQDLTLLHAAIIHEIRTSMNETSAHLAALARRRRAGSAYLNAGPIASHLQAAG